MRSMGTGDESEVGEDGNFYDNEVSYWRDRVLTFTRPAG